MTRSDAHTSLDAVHHIAIPVPDIAAAVEWYRATFQCEVAYQDATWALLRFANTAVALVIPEQHPGHIGFVHAHPERFGALTLHRDGTRSIYIRDPAGNAVELIESPPG